MMAGWDGEKRGELEGTGVEGWGWLDNEEVKDTMEREGGRSSQREQEKMERGRAW